MKVKLTIEESILGTWPGNPDVARDFLASKAPNLETVEDEIAALSLEAVVEKGKTIFPRYEGKPCLYDYQIKGFFKDACSTLSRVKTTESAKMKAYKKIIDGLIFVFPRYIPIECDVIGECQRPLRAKTPQGERVSLAISEEIPAGATVEFEIMCLDPSLEDVVYEWLDYGRLRGLGQWRNSGKGRFTYEVIG